MKIYIKCDDDLADIKAELNSKLRSITTYSELQNLIEEMDSYGRGFHFKMKTKRGGEENGMWEVDEYTVEYITTQTSDRYRCKVKNLHRFMEVV